MTAMFPSSRVWAGLADWLHDLRARRAAQSELAALDPADRARILAETGLTAEDLQAAAGRRHGLEDQQAQAMAALGIDPRAFRARNPEWQRDMARLCLACPSHGRCRTDLATGWFAERHGQYCPNSDSLVQLVVGTAA